MGAGVPWDQATRGEARDFSRSIQIAVKPGRTGGPGDAARAGAAALAGVPNPVTGKAPPGSGYAPTTVTHSESILRGFYDFHLEAGTGPIVNPFPLARGRRGRAHAHHNPMDPYRGERSGRYRPRLARRAPHHIPEEKFNELFAALGSHRDRALVAFWVSTGARASELLGLLRDMKGSVLVELMTPLGLTFYARICGWTLARAHARSGNPVAIAAYLGASDAFDKSIIDFCQRYADQNERDYQEFVTAVRSGRLEALEGV